EEFTEVGKAMAEHLAALQRTVARLGGGKAVDYAEIERAMAESAGRTELAGLRAILQSLDMDVPAVIIGGVRYTRVGRCEAPYHTMVGSVSVERSLYRQSGERGGQPGGRVVDAVSLRAGVVEDGWLPRAARVMAHAVQQGPSREAEASAREFGRLPYSRASFERVAHLVGALAGGAGGVAPGGEEGPSGEGEGERERVGPPAVFPRQFRAGGAPGRGSC